MDSELKKIFDSVMGKLVSVAIRPDDGPASVAGTGEPRRRRSTRAGAPQLPAPDADAQALATPDPPGAPDPSAAAAPSSAAASPVPQAAIIELIDVSKSFPDPRGGPALKVIENLSLTFERPGEFVVLLGPSGCGKSTVLSLISGLSLPDQGQVRVLGKHVTGPDSSSATVPQAYTCFPWRTVVENVEFGLTIQGYSKAECRQRALEYLAKVGLSDRAEARPRQLSGGMQQRVAIARTLAVRRPIVLMDEPFGALDAQTREEMQQMLLQLWDDERNTIVFVTHDITEAILLADRIIVFPQRPARAPKDLTVPLDYERPPEIVNDPRFTDFAGYLRHLLRDGIN